MRALEYLRIMKNNGQGSRHSRTQWLDKALEGKPPEIKARVLEIILKMGIDPENEFLVIFVALGQLQVLIEDSPSEWKHLFEGFQEELGEWATTNVETLSHLTHKTLAMERLAQSGREARGYLKRIGRSLQGTDRAVASLESFIDQINRSVNRLQRGLEELSHSTPSRAKETEGTTLGVSNERGSDQQVSQQSARKTEPIQSPGESRQPSPDVDRVAGKDKKRTFDLER